MGDRIDPYGELLELAERALEVARDGRFDELDDLSPAQAAMIARMPATPPRSARDALERLQGVHRELDRVLETRLEGTQRDLRALNRGRSAVQGYGRS